MIYVLHQEIDLGSHVIGLFSTIEKANVAQSVYADWYNKRHEFPPRLFIEENELDQLGLGYGDNKEILSI